MTTPAFQVALAAQPSPGRCGAPAATRVTFVVFSGDLDRLLAAFTLATGAAACGLDVSMFFTFWGTAALKTRRSSQPKTAIERALGWMLPGGLGRARLSRLDFAGLGRWLIRREMRRKGIASLEELMAAAQESGVRMAVCETSMALMGIDRTELAEWPGLEICGVAHLWDQAAEGQTVFI